MDHPTCVCGRHEWSHGGSQIGPGYLFQNATCRCCYKTSLIVSRHGYSVALISASTSGMDEYANTTLVVLARAYEAETQPVVEAYEKGLSDNIIREYGGDPEKGCLIDYLEDQEYEVIRPNNGGTYMTKDFVYKDKEGNIVLHGERAHAYHNARHRMWETKTLHPNQLVSPRNPINVPKGITAFILRDGMWQKVEPGPDQALPPDPLRVRHDAYFTEVFDAVKANTGAQFEQGTTPNKYHSDPMNAEPWFTFMVRGTTFVVGPRKRVIEIRGSSPVPLNITALRDVALTDKVTYDADGAYMGKEDTVQSFYVHAWSKEKTIEYLTLAVQMARS